MLIKGLAKKGKLYLTLLIAVALTVAAVYANAAFTSALIAAAVLLNNMSTTVNGVHIADVAAALSNRRPEVEA